MKTIHSFMLTVSMLVTSLLSFQTAAQAAEPEAAGEEARSFELAWPQGTTLTIESTEYEVVVRFNRAIDEARLRQFAEIARADLADLRWNDTSVVMRAAAGRKISAVAAAGTLRIQFLADSSVVATGPVAPAPGVDTATELAIATAQADAAAGYPHRARRRLGALADSSPNDQRLQRLLADTEAADGATALAASRYRALAADDITAQRVIAELAGNLSTGVTIRDGKSFSQIEGGFIGSIRVSRPLALGAGIRYIRSEAESVAGPLGPITDARANSTIGDITASVRIEDSVRLELKGSAQLNRDIVGGGMQAFFGSPELQGRVNLAYRLPDVSTQEQSVLGGHISRAGGGASMRLTPGIFVQGDASWNGYGLQGGGVRTKTVSAAGSLEFLLRRGTPAISVVYRLEAEYTKSTQFRGNGLAYIPLDSRENHTGQVVASLYSRNVQVTGAAGWTVDRYSGSDGPNASIGAAASLGRSWRLDGSGGVSSVSRPGNTGRYYFFRLFLTRFLG